MKFRTKTPQTYHRNKQSTIIRAELNYHDNGDIIVATGAYYVEDDSWTEPIHRAFSREDAEALQSAVNVTNGDTPLESWDKIKIACSIYELNASSGFGEWELAT